MLYKFIWMLRALFYKLFFKKIGLFTYIAKPIFLLGTRNISIGNKVRIFPGIRMEAHNGSDIIIEEDVAIGQNFHITSSKENLVISKGTTISGNVFITNIDHDYQEPAPSAASGRTPPPLPPCCYASLPRALRR